MALVVDGTTVTNAYNVDFFGNKVTKIVYVDSYPTTVWRQRQQKTVTVDVIFSAANATNLCTMTALVKLGSAMPNNLKARMTMYLAGQTVQGEEVTIPAGSKEVTLTASVAGYNAMQGQTAYGKVYLTCYLADTGSYVTAGFAGDPGITSANLPTTSGSLGPVTTEKTLYLYYDTP